MKFILVSEIFIDKYKLFPINFIIKLKILKHCNNILNTLRIKI